MSETGSNGDDDTVDDEMDIDDTDTDTVDEAITDADNDTNSNAGSENGGPTGEWINWPVEYNAKFRCLLCRFLFEKDDEFYVEDVQYTIVGPFVYKRLYSVHVHRRPDVNVCMVRDVDENNERDTNVTDAYHKTCLEAWGRLVGEPWPAFPSRVYASSFSYWLSPTWSQEVRRKDRIRRTLAEQLPNLFAELVARHLPPEIVQLILDDDLVQWLTVHAVHDIIENRNSCSVQLDMTRGIWARYAFIDGVRYIAQLTRTPPVDADDGDDTGTLSLYWCKLLDGRDARLKTQMFTLVDHLGIRQVIFGEADKTYEDYAYLHTDPASIPDAWWRTVTLRPRDNIRAYSDKIKIRAVHAVAVGDATTRAEGWDHAYRSPTPRPDPLMIDCFTNRWSLGGGLQQSGTFYMDSVILNAPGTTAYSAFWGKDRLLALRAHGSSDGQETDEDLSFYRDYDKLCPTGSNWIHFKMGPGERFTDVYRQNFTTQTTDDLLLRTNHGRSMVLAHTAIWLSLEADPELALGRYRTYHHVCSLSADEPTRISYNAAPYGVNQLAIHHPGTHGEHRNRDDQDTIDVRFYERDTTTLHHGYTFMLTSAVDLKGVVSVIPSYKRHRLTGLTMLCGMLFHYKTELNKAPHVLGEYRLDRLGSPIDLTSAERIYVGCARIRKRDRLEEEYFAHLNVDEDDIDNEEEEENMAHTYLADICSVAQVNTSRICWLSIPLDCIAELWFIGCRSHIYYPC